MRKGKKKKIIPVKADIIVQQAWEIEMLKAMLATCMNVQQLGNAVMQVMACMYVGASKKPSEEKKLSGGKPF